MNKQRIRQIINECIREFIYEDYRPNPYGDTASPLTGPRRGSHSPGLDGTIDPSSEDWNGENFKTNEHIIVSPNKFIFYKAKNFGNTDLKGTLSFFGDGSTGIAELKRAIDTLNGAAKRNHKSVFYRTITPDDKIDIAKKKDYMYHTFWEFSFDGIEWFILKPNPVQSLKLSSLKKT